MILLWFWFQGPLRLSELENRYQQCFGRPLRCTDYGFYSLGDMLARMLDQDLSIQHTRLGSVLSLKLPEQPRPQPIPQPPRTGPVKPGAIRPTPICLSSPSEPKTGPLRPEPDSGGWGESVRGLGGSGSIELSAELLLLVPCLPVRVPEQDALTCSLKGPYCTTWCLCD